MAKRYSKGDVINGYTLLQDFKLVGQCQWSFAAKGGKDYFIKEFLEPIYPLPSAPGSEKTKAQQRKECDDFEKHHTAIMNALKGKSVEGGNLVITLDFFREGARYYKTTSKIDVAGIDVSDVARLPPDKRILVLKTVASSLRILHRENIVHGDLKPDNILIKKSDSGNYIAKLIDFDSSYFSTKPAAEVVGDPVYYSPELGRYIESPESRNPSNLQLNSDIFALGLIYHQYLTGDLLGYDKTKYKYAYGSVLDGVELTVKSAIPPKLRALLQTMLRKDYTRRPEINKVLTCLGEDDILSDKPDMEKSVLAEFIEKPAKEPKPAGSGSLVIFGHRKDMGEEKISSDPSKEPELWSDSSKKPKTYLKIFGELKDV